MSIQNTTLSIEIDWEGVIKGKSPLGSLDNLKNRLGNDISCNNQGLREGSYLYTIGQYWYSIRVKNNEIYLFTYNNSSNAQATLMGVEIGGKDIYQVMGEVYLIIEEQLGIALANWYLFGNGTRSIIIRSEKGHLAVLAQSNPIQGNPIHVFQIGDENVMDLEIIPRNAVKSGKFTPKKALATLEFEADTLEEVHKMLLSQISKTGSKVVYERTISDGKPKFKNERVVEIEAESLEEAKNQILSQLPENYTLISQNEISDGKPQTIDGFGESIKAALAVATNKIPTNLECEILEKKTIIEPKYRDFLVEAYSKSEVINLFNIKKGKNAWSLSSLELISTEKKGFLWKKSKPKKYKVEYIENAYVEITYKPKAKILATIGIFFEKPKAKVLIKVANKADVDIIIDELIKIGLNEEFYSNRKNDGTYNSKGEHIEARSIGSILNEFGGIDLMRKAWYQVNNEIPGLQGKYLEYCWNNVGSWRT